MNRLNEKELDLHITILGWLHIVGNALYIVVAGFAWLLLPAIAAVSDDPDATIVLGLMGTTFGLLMVAIAIPGIVAGYGLLKHRPWARFAALVLGVLGLVNFPLGTVIGIYTLWVLMQNSANDYFSNRKLA